MLNAIAKFVAGVSLCAAHFTFAATAPEVDPLADPPSPAFEGQTAAPAPSPFVQEVIATGLELPRALVALPDGNFLVAENAGTVRILKPDGAMSEPLQGMPDILTVDGRGMNDFAIDANFAANRYVYFSYLAPAPGQRGGERSAEDRAQAAQNNQPFQIDQIARGRLSSDLSRVEDLTVIAEIPGRRIIPAPDGTLYITTMAFSDTRKLAQNIRSLNGKVLRISSDGSIPANNPYAGRSLIRQEIFSMGHRDPDGGFIHPQTGELWIVEHGPMGGDELNVVRADKNYGWPIITYGRNYDGSKIGHTSQTGLEQPLYYWFPSIAPSGLMMYTGDLFPQWQGNLFVGAMSPTQGKFLVRLVMEGERVIGEEHLLVENDRRVRAVAQGQDGALYVLTDSEANEQADRHFPGEVIRLTPR